MIESMIKDNKHGIQNENVKLKEYFIQTDKNLM